MVKRIVTKVPLEPRNLNQYTPGLLQMPVAGSALKEDQESGKVSYLIWKCHGYSNKDNKVVGFLELHTKKFNNGNHRLSFEERIIHEGGKENVINGDIVCGGEGLFSPLKWTINSSFMLPNGTVIPSLEFKQEAFVEPGRVLVYNNGKRTSLKNKQKLYSEFGIISSLGNIVDESFESELFTYIDNGLIMKKDHKMVYEPSLQTVLDGRKLHCFVQSGTGILPTEYYLDEEKKMLASISCFQAKVFNPDAEKIYNKTVAVLRKKK